MTLNPLTGSGTIWPSLSAVLVTVLVDPSPQVIVAVNLLALTSGLLSVKVKRTWLAVACPSTGRSGCSKVPPVSVLASFATLTMPPWWSVFPLVSNRLTLKPAPLSGSV